MSKESSDNANNSAEETAETASATGPASTQSASSSSANQSSESASSKRARDKGTAATGKILDEISRNTGSSSGASTVRNKRSGSGLLTLVIVLLPLLAGIGWLAWQQMLMQQALTATTQQNQQLQQGLSAQAAEIELLRQRPEPVEVPDNSAELAQLQTTLGNEIRRLQQQLADVQNRPADSAAAADFDWKIFEAEYLIDLAVRKLQLEYDLDSAVALLEQADAALLTANHAGAFTVRQAIAGDLTRLRATEDIDVEGIYLRIESLIDNVGQLDLLASMREDFERRFAEAPASTTQNSVTPEETSGWLAYTLAFLGDVFVWREWDERPEAMLAPGQESVIKLNLRLLLEQAQLALLQRNPQQYTSALQQTEEWLRRYAVLDSASGSSIAAELQALRALDINPSLPSLAASQNSIRELAEAER